MWKHTGFLFYLLGNCYLLLIKNYLCLTNQKPHRTSLLASVITLLNKLANMPWKMSAICAVLIFFKNEEFNGIQYCLDKMFVYLMDALWTFVKWVGRK